MSHEADSERFERSAADEVQVQINAAWRQSAAPDAAASVR